jgi:hypothetical protein
LAKTPLLYNPKCANLYEKEYKPRLKKEIKNMAVHCLSDGLSGYKTVDVAADEINTTE